MFKPAAAPARTHGPTVPLYSVKHHPEQGSSCWGTLRHEGHFLGCFLMETAAPHTKIRVLHKNNTLVAMLKGRDTPSNERRVTPEVPQDLGALSPHSPSTILQISWEFSPCEKMGIAKSWCLAARRCFEVCSHSLNESRCCPGSPLLPKQVDRGLGNNLEGFHNAPKNVIFFSV